METVNVSPFASPLVQVSEEVGGGWAAQVIGAPDLRATADTRVKAIEQVHALLVQRLSSGQLVALPVASPMPQKVPGWAENDPLEQEFLAELARRRQEDLEQTLHEYEEEDRQCSDTSSTPTT
jgi:hypothetical protein